MAQYGGGAIRTAPRVHRPRAVVMSAAATLASAPTTSSTPPSPPPVTAPLAPLRQPSAAPPVTLTAPRPETDRTPNEYVDTPFRNLRHHHHHQHHHQQHLHQNNHHHHHHQQPQESVVAAPAPPSRPTRLPVTKQPSHPASFSKEGAAECAATAARPSIVCPECGRCRCESCQQPRPLPQRWLCNDGCLLSADTVIDYASCLCCAKGLFYHCSESDGGGESCADEPCGCSPQRRKARWGCLGALSCLLPCLWLYWPLRGCKNVVEMCYARHSRTGCRCKPATLPTPPEKRLLDTSPQDF